MRDVAASGKIKRHTRMSTFASRTMRKTKAGSAVIAATVSLALWCTVPREARAQANPVVETLPPPNSTTPRSPFSNAAADLKAASRLTGCYAVTLGPWSTPQPKAEVPVPSRIDLLSDPHTRIYIGFGLVARTPGFAAQLEAFPAAWSPVGADSLQLRAWANGKSSVMLFLRQQPGGDELRGTLRYFTDARRVDSLDGRWLWETYPNAPASLRRTSCEAGGS
jgi:hypothetical protein